MNTSTLKENLQLAKEAIKFVDKLNITSINVPFRVTSYYKSPLSKFDQFLMFYMRTETHLGDVLVSQTAAEKSVTEESVRQKISADKQVRSQILAILHSTKSNSEKKRELKALMEKSNFDPAKFDVWWYHERTQVADELRIRACRKAIKFRHGNCGEKSAIAATWLLEKTKNQKKIFWVYAKNWDHAWVIVGDVGKITKTDVETSPINKWDENTVVADGWTSDYYAVKHPFNPLKAGSLANPFQAYVRHKVQQASTLIGCNEELQWPPVFAKGFTLANAHKHNRDQILCPAPLSYVGAKTAAMLKIADDMHQLLQELESVLAKRRGKTA